MGGFRQVSQINWMLPQKEGGKRYGRDHGNESNTIEFPLEKIFSITHYGREGENIYVHTQYNIGIGTPCEKNCGIEKVLPSATG